MSQPSTCDLSTLIDCNIATLNTASQIIQQLPADKYNHIERPYFESCLGKHMRHIVDHYLCFARDLDSGTIDYEQRQRNSQLETDKDYTLQVIATMQSFLVQLKDKHTKDQPLTVVLCSDTQLPQGEATQSSLRRELQFLQGHSVHHYAIISTMLRFYGVTVSREFGIAPSTLVHEETVKVSA